MSENQNRIPEERPFYIQPDSIIIRPELSYWELPLFPAPSPVFMTFGKEYSGPVYSGDESFDDMLKLWRQRK